MNGSATFTIRRMTASLHRALNSNVLAPLAVLSPEPVTGEFPLLSMSAPAVVAPVAVPTASALNGKTVAEPQGWNLLELTSISTVLVLLILACVVGNLLVILAILLERDLRNRPQYYLIFSLAVADLIVSFLVFSSSSLAAVFF